MSERHLDAWVAELFAAIDHKDVEGFLAFLDDACEMRFGNAPAVGGRAAVGATVAGFFDTIATLRHEIEGQWRMGDTVVVRGTVTYTRRDGSSLAVPFANIFTLRDERISSYLVYADISAL